LPSEITAADVSSQEDSIANIVQLILRLLENKPKVKEILLKALRRVSLGLRYLLFSLLFLTLLLQIPVIQTYLVGLVTQRVSENTGYQTDIGRVNIR
jgi:hypothetical protein